MKLFPKVTVVTITYNLYSDDRIELFRQCLQSVHEQTYPNIEHIVIDGASTDGTVEILKEYEKKGWIKFYSEPDKGVDDAYNKGNQKASGKYVAWMNSDDSYYDKDAIQACVEALEDNNADYCYAKQMNFDRAGEQKGVFLPRIENFWKDMPFSHQTMFVKKKVLDEIGGYNTEYGIGGDYFLVLQLILNDYKGIFVDRFVSHYTLGGFSASFDDKYRVYTCVSILSKRMTWFFKKFYPNIDEDEAQYIYWNGDDYEAYPKLFLQKMIRFMVEKKLKNFDYNLFINYVNSIIYSSKCKIKSPNQFILDSKWMKRLLKRSEKSGVTRLPYFIYKAFSLYCKTKSIFKKGK